MINIVVTSKPVDGLLYYSYEYCDYLNSNGIDAQVIVVCHRKFNPQDYLDSISKKYIHCKNIVIDSFVPKEEDITLVMGRSMITLSWQSYNDYTQLQKDTLNKVFSGNIISVYSENHPTDYAKALDFYQPKQVVDLCDTEVYPNGLGEHFEKRINFDIYKPVKKDIKFKYLFLGTNDKYYASVESIINRYPDHGIITYDFDYVNKNLNNIFVPVDNLMGMFETYVYTKSTFDPAPRIIQECKFFDKHIIYSRDKTIVDGGSVYYDRDIKEPNIGPIVRSLEEFK